MTLPTVTHSAVFTLFGVAVHCHVLSDGQRIIEADDFARLLAAMGEVDAPLDQDDQDELERFKRWHYRADRQ